MPNQYTYRRRRRVAAHRAYEALQAAGLANAAQLKYDHAYRRQFLKHVRRYGSEVMYLPGGAKLHYINGRWFVLGYNANGHDTEMGARWVNTV